MKMIQCNGCSITVPDKTNTPRERWVNIAWSWVSYTGESTIDLCPECFEKFKKMYKISSKERIQVNI